jgi:hypothetical protein
LKNQTIKVVKTLANTSKTLVIHFHGFYLKVAPSDKYSIILMVIDRLTKYVHFISITHPYTTSRVTLVFAQNVIELYRLPENIVLDRDSIFTSRF